MRSCSKRLWLAVGGALWFAASPGTVLAGAGAPPPGKPLTHAGLDAAYEAAVADKAPVLLIFGADWCQPCKLLEKDTLQVPAFLDHAGLLHLVHVDVDAQDKIASAFNVSAIPALFLLTPDKKIVSHREGYMKPEDLLAWLADGRRRLSLGQWEGTAPGSKLAELSRKAAGGSLSAAELGQIADALEDPDPAERATAARLLMAQRELAMPVLVGSLTNEYLGRRIAASEAIRKLAPNSPPFDPWLSPKETNEPFATVQKWWTDSRRLPPASSLVATDPALKGSIDAALDALRGDDPLKRTEAMSDLVTHGDAALPAIREAIKRAERTGDHRAVTLLEDVRWAILIPDSLEQQLGGIRAALARGTSPQQQAAATQLGLAGLNGIRPLAELAASNDPLVVEKAVRALSTIGGNDAVPAMAALLKSTDSNLRMTAAQALAHTKNPEATRHLLTVVDDPNEIVACAAIAGLEEIGSASSSPNRNASAEVTDALRRCLADSRWRVRAAAAEVIGKMHLTALADDLKKLLEDSDGFVVKTALTALRLVSAQPGVTQLSSISQRLPSLRGETVEIMARSKSPEVVASVREIFDSSAAPEKVKILAAISRSSQIGEGGASDDAWKPLLDHAVSSPEPTVRRAAAGALAACSPASAADLTTRLLADDDRETRRAAAQAALALLANDGPSKRSGGSIVRMSDGEVVHTGGSSTRGGTTQPVATPARLAAWHAALMRHPEPKPELAAALTLFLSGDGKSDLPVLAASFGAVDTKTLRWLGEQQVLKLVLAKLPWPEGRSVLEGICKSSGLFALAVSGSRGAPAPVADYLLEPARFHAAVEPAQGEELAAAMELLVAGESRYGNEALWSLQQPGPKAAAILIPLSTSTNAAWRAAAIYTLGRRDAATNLPLLKAATNDPVPWVRAAALQGIARVHQNDRTALETALGPFLADPDKHVMQIAATGLLEPEVRSGAGLHWQYEMFTYQAVNASLSYSITSEQRPLAPLENKPPFLDQARKRLADSDTESTALFALLLAQYGEFDGVDRLAASAASAGSSREPDMFLTAVALSRNPKYIPALRKIAQTEKEEYQLRKVLQAASQMSGPEVRQFRLDINAQIRKSSGNVIID